MDLKPVIKHNFRGYQLVNKKSEAIFYKYLDVEGGIKTLEGKTLKLTNPKDFNDPLDCYEGLISHKYNNDDLKDVYKKYVSTKISDLPRTERRKIMRDNFSNPQKFRNRQMAGILEMKEKVGICCLSEIRDNILMWSHYAEKHRGICIGYNFQQLEEEFFGLFRIDYKDEITTINKEADVLTAMCHWVLTKASDWAYEKEIRAVNIDRNGLENINPLIVREIYYGCKISNEDKRKFDAIINSQYKHVKKCQMLIDENSFKLIAKPLNI